MLLLMPLEGTHLQRPKDGRHLLKASAEASLEKNQAAGHGEGNVEIVELFCSQILKINSS